jgi:hypothetical protein
MLPDLGRVAFLQSGMKAKEHASHERAPRRLAVPQRGQGGRPGVHDKARIARNHPARTPPATAAEATSNRAGAKAG